MSVYSGHDWAEEFDGGYDNDYMYGYGGNDTLHGNLGNDYLDGGTGNDLMYGEGGNDTYVVDSAGDVVIEYLPDQGNDWVRLYNLSSYTLPDGVENLDVWNGAGGTWSGNALNNTIWGWYGNDYMYGYGGNDSLIGGGGNDLLNGGAGSDTMVGGTGDDTYAVDSIGDVVTEYAGQGNDWVRLYNLSSYTLPDNVENLDVWNGAGGWWVGNALNNTILGWYGDDTIYGGDGNDSIEGFGGFDELFGDAGNDTISNQGGWGYMDGGSGDDRIYGGSSVDTIHGGEGNDYITAGGGDDWINGEAGNDTMYGGAGDDIYSVDSVGDVVVEYAGEGTDTVRIYNLTTYTLGDNVENLDLSYDWEQRTTGGAWYGNALDNEIGGTGWDDTIVGYGGNDTLGGGAGNDCLFGNEGNDVLSGGTGTDTLYGGAGDDTLRGGNFPSHDWEHWHQEAANGDDFLGGGDGADTYWWGTKMIGNDTIGADAGNNLDTVSLAAFASSEVSVGIGGSGGDDLILTLGDGTITIQDWAKGGGYQLNTFVFSDGTKTTNGSGWL